MDQWINGQETDRLHKDLSWARRVASVVIESSKTRMAAVRNGCFPESGVCFNIYSAADEGTEVSWIEYVLAAPSEQVIGRKVCVLDHEAGPNRTCYNFYVPTHWTETLSPSGEWVMVGDVKRNSRPIPY
jgi:hypothetical protein